MRRETSTKVKMIVTQSMNEARSFDDIEVKPEHVVLALITDENNDCITIFRTLNVDTAELHDKISDFLRKSDLTPRLSAVKKVKLPFSKMFEDIIKSVDVECEKFNDATIEVAHIMLTILKFKIPITKLLSELGVNYKNFKKEFMDIKNNVDNMSENNYEDDFDDIGSEADRTKKVKRKNEVSKTPVLDNFCRDISKAVEKGQIDLVVGRSKEIKRISQILSRRKKNNPILIGEPGVGKAQPLDAKILTPNGWVTMGSIMIGDEVLTPEGKITKVIGVYPQGEKEIFKIETKDGKKTEACGEHLWKISGIPKGKSRNDINWEILNTLQIKDKLESTKYVLKIPLIKPIKTVNLDDNQFIITPYLMGLILGDGCIQDHSISISSADAEILESVEYNIGEHYKIVNKGKYDYRIVENQKNNFKKRTRPNKGEICNDILKEFYNLGLNDCKSHEKFIPKSYFTTTLKNKLALIQGLMDTDGTVTKTGAISFSTTSSRLAKDLQELIWSIGGLCLIKEKQTYYTYLGVKKTGRISYNLKIRYKNPLDLFKLKRKSDRISKNYQYRDQLKNEITSITSVGFKQAQCIMVEDKEHLYITDDYIVTHNTAIVEGLAQLIKDGGAPRTLSNKKIYALDLASIVAGTKYRGQFEERMKAILEECKANPDIMLFIDELHTIVGAGNASGSLDASNIFKPALARGEIQVIGATTLDEYRENIEKDGALTRRFQQVLVEQPTLEETKIILNNIKDKYEKHHKVVYTPEAIDECVKLSDRYIMERSMPDKAIDVLDEAGAACNVNIEKPQVIKDLELKLTEILNKKKQVVAKQKYEEAAKLRDTEDKIKDQLSAATKDWSSKIDKNVSTVGVEQIAEVVSMMTGIPLTKLSTQESKKLRDLDKELMGKVIGQDTAVSKVIKSIKRSRVGLKDKNKPVGSYIFLGPTGVGKSFLAKLLAEFVYGDEEALVRIDMSEYMDKHNVSRLIGAPPGFVGYDQGGQLTEKIRRKPHSVILFDEIEKAHEDVFNVLLQVLDDGQLTDGLGRKVNFKNCLIIMTSNIGVKELEMGKNTLGFETTATVAMEEGKIKNIIDKALKNKFKPEFLNRIDEAIIFNSLKPEDIHKIIYNDIAKFEKKLKEIGLKIEISSEAVNFLGEEGYDKAYGARPLAKTIQRYVEDPIADEILNDNIKDGDTIKITFDPDKKEIKIDKAE